MNVQFQSIFDELQSQHEEILNSIKDISSEMFNKQPAPGKWSINQILMHIITSEKLSLGYMKKKSQGINKLGNSGLGEKLRLWLLIVSQRLPLKYKAPKQLEQNTPQANSVADLIAQWKQLRTELAAFLDTIDEKNVSKVIYKHPFAGRFSAKQTLIFFREHIIHHHPQITRILNNPNA